MLAPASHPPHPTPSRRPPVVRASWIALALALPLAPAWAQDGVEDLLQAARPATAPAAVAPPSATQNKPTTDALGTLQPKAPEGARQGAITLSNGIKLEGRIWTTLNTPFRVWIEESKTYRDLDLASLQRIDVHVLSATMEDDWRWLKEGSDQKVYSGQKYPNVSLAYKFTLANDQVIEGTIVAGVYFADATRSRTLALYKIYRGNLDETLKDLVYITSIVFARADPGAAPPDAQPAPGRTAKLPLLED